MSHRTLRFLSLSLLLLTLAVAVSSGAAQPAGPVTALLAVEVPTAAGLHRFQQSGAVAYDVVVGDLLLAGADAAARGALAAAGLRTRLLDADTAGATYTWAAALPGRPAPDWSRFGHVLLANGHQVLLRVTPATVERLAAAGAEVRRLLLRPVILEAAGPAAPLPRLLDAEPAIQAMIDQVNALAVAAYDGGLSGEHPVTVGGTPYTIPTRYTFSGTPIERATQYTGEQLAGAGLAVEYHQWSGATYPNVVGEITGQVNPDEIYMITAHLDSTSQSATTSAPGADDNASGSTAVLLAAEILSQYWWDCTLRFALWTGEEQGLLGSDAYAQRAAANGENIAGVLNLDMIGYNSDSAPILDLHARSAIPQSVAIANLFSDVVGTYNLNLAPQLLVDNWLGNYSDNKSFWDVGYPAILAIEDYDDFTPYYHTTGDRLATLDLAYFTEMVKAGVGTFAHMTGCLDTDTEVDIYLPFVRVGP